MTKKYFSVNKEGREIIHSISPLVFVCVCWVYAYICVWLHIQKKVWKMNKTMSRMTNWRMRWGNPEEDIYFNLMVKVNFF